MTTTRKLLPTSRHDLPEWEVTTDGRIIGWVRQIKIGRGASTFYEAIGIDQDGARVSLEVHIDFDDRVNTVVRFQDNPEPFRGIHWHPAPRREGEHNDSPEN